jgi:hypothetical protein
MYQGSEEGKRGGTTRLNDMVYFDHDYHNLTRLMSNWHSPSAVVGIIVV